jgi:hypothetical protein
MPEPGRIGELGPEHREFDQKLRSTFFPQREDRCGHGKTWDEECPACADVWRQEQVKLLRAQAAKYGFKLVPSN